MGERNIYWKIDASQFFLKIFSQDYGKLLKVTLWEWHAKLACKYCFIRGKPLHWCWVAQHKQVTIGGRGPALFKPDGKVSINRSVLSKWFPHPVQSRAPELFLGTSLLRYFDFFYLLGPTTRETVLSQRSWGQVWRSYCIMATAICWLCCCKYTPLETI